MLKIWGRRSAYNVQKALFMLGEVGLEHEHVEVGGSAGGLDTKEFLAMNPHGQIPVVVDGDATLWESNSIVRYLGACYGHGSLWLEDPAERSQAERWMDWELASLQPAFIALFWGFYRTPEADRDERRLAQASARCDALYALLDDHLASQPYLAGDHFTMGDVPAATTLYRYFEMGAPVADVPNVRRWYESLAERPAFRTHIMRPFDELRGRRAH